jgi:hypothetical protein
MISSTKIQGWMWWYVPVIPAFYEMEIGRIETVGHSW